MKCPNISNPTKFHTPTVSIRVRYVVTGPLPLAQPYLECSENEYICVSIFHDT